MTGGNVDQAPVMRGNEFHKALTTAFGYTSMMWNRFSLQKYDVQKAMREGNYFDASAIAARSFVYTFAMPAMITALTREFIGNNSSSANDEDRTKRLIGSAVEEMLPTKFIPVARDLVSYGIKKAMGEHAGAFQATPLEGAAQALLDPAADVFHAAFSDNHQLDPKFAEHATHAVSLVAGFPKSADDVVFNFLDWQAGHGELTMKDFLSRRKSTPQNRYEAQR